MIILCFVLNAQIELFAGSHDLQLETLSISAGNRREDNISVHTALHSGTEWRLQPGYDHCSGV